jgi:hypothetical protein
MSLPGDLAAMPAALRKYRDEDEKIWRPASFELAITHQTNREIITW